MALNSKSYRAGLVGDGSNKIWNSGRQKKEEKLTGFSPAEGQKQKENYTGKSQLFCTYLWKTAERKSDISFLSCILIVYV